MTARPAALAALRHELRGLGRVAVAFSGGADSALLAWAAADTLGADHAPAYTAISASLARAEHQDCADLAREWGLEWHAVATDELARPEYARNDGDRCAACKTALMDVLEPVAAVADATVVLGVNVDDLGDHRPGQAAALARGARFPLLDAGFTKEMVRAVSRDLGLRTWDKPAAACLASRVPYGTPVTVALLSAVDRAEAALHRLGFPEVRVRAHGDAARVEVPVDRLDHALARRDQVTGAVRAAGFLWVSLDLEGLRSGSLNRALSGG